MSDCVLNLGDCLQGLISLADKSVDVTLMDPPYEAQAHTKGRRIHNPRTNELRMAPLSFDPISEDDRTEAAAHAARTTKRWIIVFCQMEAADKWATALVCGGARYIRTGVWVKPNGQPQLTGDRPGVGYETLVIGYGTQGQMHWNGGGKRAVWEFPVDANFSRTERVHPTQKPLPLIEALISDFTDPDELVCDPFAGSGTTGVACKRLGRRFIGWEKDERFHAAAVRRIEAARQQGEMFPRTAKPRQARLLP